MKAHRFHPSLLRAYDVRGIFGETLGEDDAHALGRSFATVLHRQTDVSGRRPRVVVGYDGRLSSPVLKEALVAGLCACGIDVVRIGLAASPMLYFAERSIDQVEGGIQVTGSHNPRDHNGFKIVLGGRPFFGEALASLDGIAAAGDWLLPGSVVAEARRSQRHDVMPAYLDALLGALAGAAGGLAQIDDLRIGWDTGNGAAGPLVERLVARLPGEHHMLFSEVDGRFPNHHPDPTIEANLADLRALVTGKKLDFGVAFDGDGDRLGVVDGAGRVVWADRLLALFAADVLEAYPGASVVGDVKMSQVTFDAVASLGGRPVMAPSGHSPIKAAMRETGALLGGEMSGHFFFADRYLGFDDGPYAALRLIAASAGKGRALADLVDALPPACATPEMRFAVAPERRLAVVEEVAARLAARGREVCTIDGVRVSSQEGWWLLRASNTQDMLTARAEAASPEALARLVAEIDTELAASGVTRG